MKAVVKEEALEVELKTEKVMLEVTAPGPAHGPETPAKLAQLCRSVRGSVRSPVCA
jgi:hypothetical protein